MSHLTIAHLPTLAADRPRKRHLMAPVRLLLAAAAAASLAACGGGGEDDLDDLGFDEVAEAPRDLPSGPPVTREAAAGVSIGDVGAFETTVCTGTIGNVRLDTVVVPDDRRCVLEGTRLIGSIIVGTRAVLDARGVRVNGNVQAEGARTVRLVEGSIVGGSVQLKQGNAAAVVGASINGDLQLDANRGQLRANQNRVGGNVQIVGNSGGVAVNRNVIDGALQCKENQPAPVGSGNRASSKEGQCARL